VPDLDCDGIDRVAVRDRDVVLERDGVRLGMDKSSSGDSVADEEGVSDGVTEPVGVADGDEEQVTEGVRDTDGVTDTVAVTEMVDDLDVNSGSTRVGDRAG
jgi:hypothetical protein